MIPITPGIAIDESEIELTYVRSSGPGGQHVNKLATAAQLRFNVKGSPSLAPEVKDRLVRLAGRRMTDDGVLIIDARRSRSQLANREDAIARLVDLIRRAARPPRRRLPTKPTAASRRRRLAAKRRRSELKTSRRRPSIDDN